MRIHVKNCDEQKMRKGIVYGFLLGVFPLLSLQSFLGFILLLFLNIGILPATLSFFLMKGAFFLLDTPLQFLGSWILELTFLQKFFTLLYNIPLVALTRFHESQIMGGMIVGITLLPILYFAAGLIPKKYPWTSFSNFYIKCLGVCGCMLYLALSINTKIKNSIESILSTSYGLEVSIEEIETSLTKNEVKIKRIEFPSYVASSQNFVEISDISLKFSPTAFLWGRIVIEDAVINSIQLNTQRSSEKENKKTSLIHDAELSNLRVFLRRNLNNFITGMSLDQFQSLLSTSDPLEKVSTINEKLLSENKTEEIIQKNKEKMKNWKKKIQLIMEDKSLSKNESKLKLKDIEFEINESDSSVNQLNDLQNQDLLKIRSELAIPEHAISDLSVQIFAENAIDDLVAINKHHSLIKYFFNPIKNGVYRFPVWNDYPSFWLKRLKFSSTSPKSPAHGHLNGELTDLTTNPQIVNRPMVMIINGSFPKNEIFGLFATLTLDHRDGRADSFSLNIKNYAENLLLFYPKEKSVLELTKARGSLTYLVQTSDEKFRVESVREIKSYTSKNQIKNKFIKSIVEKALAESPSIRIHTRATGNWKNNNIEIQSNLGKALAKELFIDNKSQLHSLNKKIEELFAHKIQTSKDELQEQMNSINLIKKEIQHFVNE